MIIEYKVREQCVNLDNFIVIIVLQQYCLKTLGHKFMLYFMSVKTDQIH